MEPAWVTRATRLPELSLARPSVQSVRILATSASGVQLDLKHTSSSHSAGLESFSSQGVVLHVGPRHELPVHGGVESDGEQAQDTALSR